MQMQEPGERRMSRGEIAGVQAKRAGLRLVSGGLWIFAAAGAILTVGAGIAVCLVVSDKEFGNAAGWLGIGLACAGFCAACGSVARRVAERVAAMDPRIAPVDADASGLAAFDGPLYASEEFLQTQAKLHASRLMDTQPQDWQEEAPEETWAQASAEPPRSVEPKALPRKDRLPAVAFVQDRFYPLLLFIAGVTMVVWNHISILHHHILFYYAIIFGPPALWGGLAALFDPHIVNSHLGLTPLGRRLFLAAIILSVLSVVFLIWLYAVYYRVR